MYFFSLNLQAENSLLGVTNGLSKMWILQILVKHTIMYFTSLIVSFYEQLQVNALKSLVVEWVAILVNTVA